MIRTECATLNSEMVEKIKIAQDDLVYWGVDTCTDIINILIYADDYSEEERISLMRRIGLIRDFISVFRLNNEEGGLV